MNPFFAFLSPGPGEIFVIGIIAVLLFGKRLPEVGRSLGKSFIEFKKGLYEIQDEIGRATDIDSSDWDDEPKTLETERHEPVAPRFEAPVSEPVEKSEKAR